MIEFRSPRAFPLFVACLAAFLLLTPAQAWQKRTSLYVEPFATKEHAESLRDDVAAELRKLGSLSLTASEADADFVLGGGGEVWVRGYRSLNPRSGRLPSDGTPVYGGYLSVELRDRHGDTVWSWLAAPGAGSGDIDRELAKEIAKRVAQALSEGSPAAAPHAAVGGSLPSTTLGGAGATFPQPLYAKWIVNYRKVNPGVAITYEAVGSEAGVRSLLAGAVDFGASDSPEAVAQLAPGDESKYLLFPSTAGAVVPIVNIPGLSADLSFTSEILAGIYLGRITRWGDPALRAANPRVHLPDLPIVPVHRSDGSGTSYVWTDYLSRTNSEWKSRVGAALAPAWPAGRAANGNEGVAAMVKELGGSIGYVEFIYALRNHLSFGRVRNRNGEFVAAGLAGIMAAVRGAAFTNRDLKISIVDAPGPGAYPISSFTWLVVPAHFANEGKRAAMTDFLRWMLGPGQMQAAALGYLELPKELVAREEAALEGIRP